ncbi:hypothetical protein [uncultured Croceitalea sp.]|uniref:hypothetical protein n=1 Tax=uncultured Croceitalea sp. TaxID=1798908 RepID=UPI00330586A5
MKNNYDSSSFKKLLDKLQQESWQLELIISGFAIYGLWQSIETLEIEYIKAVKYDESLYEYILGPTLNGVSVLIVVLLIHVILRGLWIGTLGLRYISGEIEYEELGYTDKFNSYLRTKVGTFDRYISRLENICSTMFALAFLMVFYLLSYFLITGVFLLIRYLIAQQDWFSDTTANIILLVFAIPYLLCIFLVFIDFISLGFLKKNRWTTKIYFPIYRLFGFITLSFLYRPLVYNFLDQKKARWVAQFITPVYFILGLVFASYGKLNSNYQVHNQATSSIYTNRLNYDDELIEKKDMVQFVSIPSKVIDKPYMRVFVGFNDFIENAIIAHDSVLAPTNDKRGYLFQLEKLANSRGNAVQPKAAMIANQKRYLNALNELYHIKIDTTVFLTDFVFTSTKKKRFGFETYLDLKGLENGKHLLRYIGPDPRENKMKDTLITIPFWYFND